MLTVLIVTVTVDLLVAVGIGMVMASFLFMQRITDMQIASMKAITKPGEDSVYERALSKQETEIMEQADGQIMLFHMRGAMSFSSAKSLVRRHAMVTEYKVMILDLSDVPSIDFTTSRALEDIITDTINNGEQIILVGACSDVYKMLENQDVIQCLNTDNIFQNRIDALVHAQKLLTSN